MADDEYIRFAEARIAQQGRELDREAHADQTHCYTCGKPFVRVKYECPTCGEWQCSEECRKKHIETLDNI